jgi:hypothetical protein
LSDLAFCSTNNFGFIHPADFTISHFGVLFLCPFDHFHFSFPVAPNHFLYRFLLRHLWRAFVFGNTFLCANFPPAFSLSMAHLVGYFQMLQALLFLIRL